MKAKMIEDPLLREEEDGAEALLKEKVTAEDMLKYAEALRATAELYVVHEDENPKEAKSLAEQALDICRSNAGQSSWSRSLLESLESFVRETHTLVRQYEHNRDYVKILGAPGQISTKVDERKAVRLHKKEFQKIGVEMASG